MAHLRLIEPNEVAVLPTAADDKRVAERSRVLMKAVMRVRGQTLQYPITVRDISSTGLKASVEVSLFPGTRVEVELRNIGWIPAVVVRAGPNGEIGINFSAVINPEETKVQISGSYAAVPSGLNSQLRTV